MNARFLLIIVLILFKNASAQHKDVIALEAQIKEVASRCTPATVQVARYDSIRKKLTAGRASGVVVSEDGIVLTAGHVCNPDSIYQIKFVNGTQVMAIGLGRIRHLDVGMLRIIKQGKYPYAEMGWSSSLQENEPCVSIAYPGSLIVKKTVVRFGYVVEIETGKDLKMKTTCLMEPGDSGGPVFDLLGRVIGVRSDIYVSLKDNFEAPIKNFRKYWTALQRPVSYTDLPAEDSIPVDMAAGMLPRIDVKKVLKLIADQEEELGRHCIQLTSISNKDTCKAFGTLLNLKSFPVDGTQKKYSYIISKNSMVGEAPMALIKGKMKALKVMGRDSNQDLVLLQLEEKNKDAFRLKKGTATDLIPAGSFLLSPSCEDEGEASVMGTGMLDLFLVASSGWLGIGMEYKKGRIVVSRVEPNSPASDAMMEKGDVIISYNGVKQDSIHRLVGALQMKLPGESVSFVLSRNNVVDTLNIVLKERPEREGRHVADFFRDGKSDRRDGFKNVFVHDGKIKPAECGGPIFDLYNNFIGINMARKSRTSSIGMPVSEVIKFIEEIMKSYAIHS